MTETRLNAVVAETVLENLADFWADPLPDIMGRQPARIAGSPHDQQVPEGVRNPYWEIVPAASRLRDRPAIREPLPA